MSIYSVNNRLAGTQQNLASTFKTLIGVNAATATLRRGRAWSIVMGADGAPNASDCQIVYDVSRMTAAGTGTSATPTSPDNAGVASDAVATVNYTVEPTVTAASSLKAFALNQRASFQWAAYDKDQCLVWPATNLAGLVVRALSPTYASPALAQLDFEDY